MPLTPTPSGRGRPLTITRERLMRAGMTLGLPNITLLGIAQELGVSAKALYKHFSGLDSLKQLIAEEMFLHWPLPPLPEPGQGNLEQYLMQMSDCMWDLVDRYTGIAPYMLREDKITPAMLGKMAEHQQALASCFGMTPAQSHWLLFTITYHCVAVADTARPPCPPEESSPACRQADARIRKLYDLGSRALTIGALAILDDIPDAV